MSETLPERAEPGQRLAIAAEAIYLVNLLLVPGPAFVVLLYLHHRYRNGGPALARCHLRQTVAASLWAGVLLLLVAALILGVGGLGNIGAWTVVLIYLVTCHSALVLLGVFGLAKAMAGKPWRYPLVGRPCPEEEPR